MRAIATSAFAATLALSGAAWAQTSDQQQTQGGTSQQTTGQQATGQQGSGQQGSGQQATGQQMTGQQGGDQETAASRQRVQQQLTQAGFEDVQILDTAYLVEARTPQGETVTMIVNPAQGTAQVIGREQPGATGSTGGAGQTGSGQTGSGQTGSGQTGSGQTGSGQSQPGQQQSQ